MPHSIRINGRALRFDQVHPLTGREHWSLCAPQDCVTYSRHPERPEWRDSRDNPLPHRLVPQLEAGRLKHRHALPHPNTFRAAPPLC